jgi:phosphoribosylformimino-5-aminoimidazole carboxamide ribotide isomerase
VIAYPAVDIRAGAAVQLVGGRVEETRVTVPDPVGVARRWADAGFRALHVVDLDAALGSGDNRGIIADLIRAVDVPVHVGGGVRDDAAADALFEMGAERIVVGTRALEDEAWLLALATRRPGRVMVAADVRDGRVLTHGWTVVSQRTAENLLDALAEAPLAAILVTDVSREGLMAGADDSLFARLARATAHDLIAAGGIASLDDLRALERAGAAGAVLGMALYTGAIDGAVAAGEFHT